MSGPYASAGQFTMPGGLLLADGRRLAAAELRPLTGREEDWLATSPALPNALAVTRLLEACLLGLDGVPPTRELVRSLLVGDRDYLMLQLRRLTLGERYQAVFVCPACAARMDVDFTAADVPVETRPQTTGHYALELGDGRTVVFRLPNGADQESVLEVDVAGRTAALLARCLLEHGAGPLSADEGERVAAAMEELAPQVDLELDLTCPECSHAFVAQFDPTAFFLSEMRANAGKLLHEVHHLAFYYHWAEADILSLTRQRRRAYLALLSETLRPEG